MKTVYVKSRNAQNENDYETWMVGVARTLNEFENQTDTRATVIIVDICGDEILPMDS